MIHAKNISVWLRDTLWILSCLAELQCIRFIKDMQLSHTLDQQPTRNQTLNIMNHHVLETQNCIFNRPCVSRSYSTITSVIQWFLKSSFSQNTFLTMSIPNRTFWENVHPTLCVACHVSRFTCHVSPVTCHLSHVKIFF